VIRSSASQDPGYDNASGGGSASTADQPRPLSQKQPNQGSLLIDATCAPVDIRHPTDLSLLNEAREVTEIIIDAMHPQIRKSFGHKPRTHRKKARQQFLAVALAEGFCEAVEEEAPYQQDMQGHQSAARPLEAKPLEH
jgi:transposase, IS5 family